MISTLMICDGDGRYLEIKGAGIPEEVLNLKKRVGVFENINKLTTFQWFFKQ